ncbi:PP-loop family-domain-containing protein [Geopyxis carbonaria]|nr:PP-loop family-domain-containing protein [Geopyxis carbonaria]
MGPHASQDRSASFLIAARSNPADRRPGLAISGGVDSMALAYHMKTFKDARSQAVVHAFIVDHGVRPGSNVEAERVAEIMARFNIRPHVLKLDWQGEPGKHGFETLARMKRYQALAKACVQNEIEHVLLGHHADDQVETVMMRMISRCRGTALACIKPTAWMPETYGIHGTEHIQIGRPFLDIPKARLKSTCERSQVPWFEDHTNQDASLTARNAVRQLLSEEPSQLPRALQRSSLFAVSKRTAATADAIEEQATALLEKCNIILNPKWGTVETSLPDTALDAMTTLEALATIRAITRITEILCPTARVKRSNIVSLFLDIYGDTRRPSALSAAEVLWRREPNGRWTLTRTAFPQANIRRPDSTVVTFAPNYRREWSEWKLWDGRWWIRVRHLDPSIGPVGVRHLRKEDMVQVSRHLMWRYKKGDAVGTELPPGAVRFSLPVLYMHNQDDEAMIGLPSIGISLLNRKYGGGEDNGARLIDWGVKFRGPL